MWEAATSLVKKSRCYCYLPTRLIVISFSRFSDFPLVYELPQYVLGTQCCSLFPSSLHPARFFIFFLSVSLLLVWGCDPWTFLRCSVFCEGVYSLGGERVGVAVWSLLPLLSPPLPGQTHAPLRKPRQYFWTLSTWHHLLCFLFTYCWCLCCPPFLRWVSSVHSLLGNKNHGKSKAETVKWWSLTICSPPWLLLPLPVAYIWSLRLGQLSAISILPEIQKWGRSVKMKVKCGYNINRNVDCEYRLKICDCR